MEGNECGRGCATAAATLQGIQRYYATALLHTAICHVAGTKQNLFEFQGVAMQGQLDDAEFQRTVLRVYL